MEGERLIEFYQEQAGAQSVVGCVFLGRVERVLPDVKAAFVRLGLSQTDSSRCESLRVITAPAAPRR